jgi:hypothetical protein
MTILGKHWLEIMRLKIAGKYGYMIEDLYTHYAPTFMSS